MIRRTTAMPARLTRLWTKQLYREYTHILHWYDLTQAMAPVALAIASITNYGEWRPATRTIVMADHLIRDYPWNVVLEVLKHEMAHQYVHEVLGHQAERPHGERFKEACHRLGVPAWAASASGTLPPEMGQAITRHLSAEEERLLRRCELTEIMRLGHLKMRLADRNAAKYHHSKGNAKFSGQLSRINVSQKLTQSQN